MTPTPIRAATVPPGSRIARHLPGAYFHDCFETTLPDPRRTALEVYLDTVTRTPAWIERAMAARNRVVALFGLKDLGGLGAIDRTKPAAAYRVGDRIGIFTIGSSSDDEVVLGDSDRHLDVKVSVCRLDGARVAVSTVVHVHNLLGRLYLLPVVPMHKLIVPAMMRRLLAAT